MNRMFRPITLFTLFFTLLILASGSQFTFKDLREIPAATADPNDSEGLYLQGAKALYAAGVPLDLERASSLLSQSASQGHPGAMSHLAFMYSNGLGVPRDEPKATVLHTFAARAAQHASSLALGYRYSRHPAMQCDAAYSYHAVARYVQIMRQRAPEQMPFVEGVRIPGSGAGLYEGEQRGVRAHHGGERDAVVQFVQHLAERAGNVDAMRQLGQLFYYGARGMQRDTQRAAQFFQRAAERGDAQAMAFLGEMNAKGVGLRESNLTRSREMYERAAALGNVQALNGLGYLHSHEGNYTAAQAFFLQAAQKGDSDASYNLGVIAYRGLVTGEVNYTEALGYFQEAALKGHQAASFQLGVMKYRGLGTKVDCGAAVRLLRPAAESGPWGAIQRWALEAYLEGRYDSALMLYLRGSEMGLLAATTNAAWLLRMRPRGLHVFLPGAGRPVTTLARLLLSPSPPPWASPSLYHELLVELERRAGEMGATDAALRLADALRLGRGVPRSPSKAVALLRTLGHRGRDGFKAHLAARFQLARMYERGEGGLPLDWNLAKSLFDAAMDRPRSPYNLPVLLSLLRMRLALWLGPRLVYPGANITASVAELRKAFAKAPPAGTIASSASGRGFSLFGGGSTARAVRWRLFSAVVREVWREAGVSLEDVALVLLTASLVGVVGYLAAKHLLTQRLRERERELGLAEGLGGEGPQGAGEEGPQVQGPARAPLVGLAEDQARGEVPAAAAI